MDLWNDLWMDGLMDGRMDGWIDGWTDGWMDGRMDVSTIPTSVCLFLRVYVSVCLCYVSASP